MDQLKEAATSSRVVPAEIEENVEDLVSKIFIVRKKNFTSFYETKDILEELDEKEPASQQRSGICQLSNRLCPSI